MSVADAESSGNFAPPKEQRARTSVVTWPTLSSLRPILLPLLTTTVLLGGWEAAVRILAVPAVTLPAPSAIFANLVRNFPLLMVNAWATASEAIAGLALAIVLGMAVGSLISYAKVFREAVYPHLVFFQLIPKVALAPLFIMWLGIGTEARLAFTIFIAFFPILIATASGLENVEQRYITFSKGITASKWQTFLHVRLPFALPQIFSGLKIGVTMAFIGIIVGEFITSQSGLGYLILYASTRADTTTIFSSILVLCAIGMLIYGLLMVVERIVLNRFDAR